LANDLFGGIFLSCLPENPIASLTLFFLTQTRTGSAFEMHLSSVMVDYMWALAKLGLSFDVSNSFMSSWLATNPVDVSLSLFLSICLPVSPTLAKGEEGSLSILKNNSEYFGSLKCYGLSQHSEHFSGCSVFGLFCLPKTLFESIVYVRQKILYTWKNYTPQRVKINIHS
jgi:hypothetical protein